MKMIFIVFLLLTAAAIPARAETIFLKNGKIIQGRIIERAEAYISVRVDGRRQRYSRGQILRIVEEGKSIFEASETEQEQERSAGRKKELIRRLLEAMDVPDSLNRLFLRLSQDAPEEAQTELRRLLKTDVLLERIIPIYDQHYSEDELESLIEFYSSPVGKKHLETTPVIMEETMRKCMQYFKEQSAQE